jgi:hypothetical protein
MFLTKATVQGKIKPQSMETKGRRGEEREKKSLVQQSIA